MIEQKPVKITETILRDAHQSLIATRMTTDQMLPIIEKMDKVGYHAIECWGGATFDASLRFLKEDPWVRLRKLRDGFKNTKLQMLFRGQNILGYRHYADDVVEYFVQKSIANGIDIIRIFDALNDTRNLECAVKAAKKENGHAQIAISYTLGEAYTTEYYINLAKEIETLGADSICIKDMAGLLVPYEAANLVTALKAAVSLPIDLHTHYTSGVAAMTYMKAVEAGCDIIDTAMSPFAMGTSQPATEVMVETFRGTPYDTGFDQQQLAEIADYFRPIRDNALDTGLLNPKVMGVDIQTLLYQVPGGMLSNLVSQLKEQKAEDKYYEVLKEIPRVRKDFGEPPLVTPSSQIVGTQAVLNVIAGERYKLVTKETKAVLSGEYGKTVKEFDPEVQKKVIGDVQPITCRPADLLQPELPKLENEIKQWKEQDEDVLSYALFPQVAMEYFKYREAQKSKMDITLADTETKAYPV
ncbi:oxaloacetate decarboxylase [Anaerocolumna cellulosilytica]|uniref:Oxaloacetate decarboxylase n=1 Tax=Anaerocolumna cellulosilytica TaxID=433286 RepID=A0A6S6R7W4_9FIRM|nr:oxaloacetate decarboxylase subunit alpha [Anaerocolumna cellulosilytica]MBB5197573.1 oxaloacetate decarboxylase alpha subunit [Anaerocolumna cellulosilytica]BCJ95098.1 oxaloacetate decarboxylase [Anaerocolumna cellulosilytica]